MPQIKKKKTTTAPPPKKTQTKIPNQTKPTQNQLNPQNLRPPNTFAKQINKKLQPSKKTPKHQTSDVKEGVKLDDFSETVYFQQCTVRSGMKDVLNQRSLQ